VAKFNPSLSGAASLVYSTYLGGSGYDGEYTDYPNVLTLREPGPGIAVDSAGDAYVTGTTTSANFPTTPGAFQTAYHNASHSWQQGDAFEGLHPRALLEALQGPLAGRHVLPPAAPALPGR
jgi:hypothetical protein